MDRTISPHDLKKLRDSSPFVLLDVRRKSDLDASREKILGATWCDPDAMDEWLDKIPKHREVVLYCVRGGCECRVASARRRRSGQCGQGWLRDWR